MRKIKMTVIGVVVMMMCSAVVIGQNQPQWTVVYSQVLTDQTTSIPDTVIFNVTQSGQYRLTPYFSGNDGSARLALFRWIDVNGQAQKLFLTEQGQGEPLNPVLMILPKVGTTVRYSVSSITGSFNIAYTVEQLQSKRGG